MRSPARRHSVGARFRELRTQFGATQAEVAEAAKVSERKIRDLESGESISERILGLAIDGLNVLRQQNGRRPVVLEAKDGEEILNESGPAWLELPGRNWLKNVHGPGALLTADFRVVPFHGQRSLEELDRLEQWCLDPRNDFGIRVYKGQAGIGKTRLAIELCHRLATLSQQPWTAGFAIHDRFPAGPNPWTALPERRRPILVVVDYAGEEEKTAMITRLLTDASLCPAPQLRLLFLERDDQWLDRLHESRAAREILSGPALSRAGRQETHLLPPVAETAAERMESYRHAGREFGQKLGFKSPPLPDKSISAQFYRSVLFLHMRALLTLLGSEADSKKAILRAMLARERDYWKKRLATVGLTPSLLPIVEAAAAKISARNGVADKGACLSLLRKLSVSKDQPEVVLVQVYQVLRECYPSGVSGVGPVQPDELKQTLIDAAFDQL